ncbi:MAG: hypothetical protein GF330_05820 [Candidatus Eisenbacteria bacterium]|nr:hypothetical protein [Candidatus Eisenbacteria bacterium]
MNLGVFDWGWANRAQRESDIEYCTRGLPASDPTLREISRIDARVICRRRCDLVADDVWFHSPHHRDYFRRWGIGDFLYSLTRPDPRSGVSRHWINLGRDASAPRFSHKDRRLLLLFVTEVRRELGRSLAPFGSARMPKLAPRLMQVLDLLAQGRSEKQIASRLGISPHTVHGYAKQLHRRFGATSRAELLARFQALRPRPPAVPRSAPRRTRESRAAI